MFFDKETFGSDRLVHRRAATRLPAGAGRPSSPRRRSATRSAPTSCKIETATDDLLPGLTSDQKKDRLSRLSYKDYLSTIVKADPGVMPFYQHRTDELWGCGIDAVSALDCWGVGLPGFAGLKLEARRLDARAWAIRRAGYSDDRRLRHLPFPGRQRLDRAAAGARPDPRQRSEAMTRRTSSPPRPTTPSSTCAGNAVRIRLNSIVGARAQCEGRRRDRLHATPGGGKR